MIEEVKYKVLTAEEAIWYALRTDTRTIGTIKNLGMGSTLTISFPITITVDQAIAKQVLKEYLDEDMHN